MTHVTNVERILNSIFWNMFYAYFALNVSLYIEILARITN
jgi:hypothetical protein